MDSPDDSPGSPPPPSPAAQRQAQQILTSVSSSTARTPADPRRKKNVSRNRREAIVAIFLLVFLLNAFNGRAIIKSVNSQFEGWQQYYSSNATGDPRGERRSENPVGDTAVIVTSSWIPSHPSTFMVETVVNSTARLKGLSPHAPIFVTVDHFRFWAFKDFPPELKEKIDNLEAYTVNLYHRYLKEPRVHVIPAVKNLHIGGSVMKALNLIKGHYPSIRYVYYLQHDFYFTRDIDHSALVRAMDDHPDKINYVRFPKKNPWLISRQCGSEKPIHYNRTMPTAASDGAGPDPGADPADDYLTVLRLRGASNSSYEDETRKATDGTEAGAGMEAGDGGPPPPLTLFPTSSYSDNNHLVRLPWYRDTIASMIKLDRPPEDPLQSRANDGCNGRPNVAPLYGLYLYHEKCIGHLDGRHRKFTP